MAFVSTVVNSNQSNAIKLVGIVTKVVDGGLALVDTPEIGKRGMTDQSILLIPLCLGNLWKERDLDVDSVQRREDRYGREVGVVYCDGVNVNDKLMANKKGENPIRVLRHNRIF